MVEGAPARGHLRRRDPDGRGAEAGRDDARRVGEPRRPPDPQVGRSIPDPDRGRWRRGRPLLGGARPVRRNADTAGDEGGAMEYVSPIDPRVAEPLERAPRPAALEGRRVVLLDITKNRGKEFLDRVEQHLKRRGAHT